jgi:hypothetical protein
LNVVADRVVVEGAGNGAGLRRRLHIQNRVVTTLAVQDLVDLPKGIDSVPNCPSFHACFQPIVDLFLNLLGPDFVAAEMPESC